MTDKEKHSVLTGCLEMGKLQMTVLDGMLESDFTEERRKQIMNTRNELIADSRALTLLARELGMSE